MKVSGHPGSADYRFSWGWSVIAPMVQVLTRQPIPMQVADGFGACLGRPDFV